MEEVWKRRRGGVSYGVSGQHDDDDEDEVKSTDSNAGNLKRCKGAVYRFIRSIGFYDEDELLFIHSSWELLEKGTGKFSLALDYLVYRSFYALILSGLVIYSVAVDSNDLGIYPVLLFASTGFHIIYSLLYTLHIVSGKTHRAKVNPHDTDVEGQLQVEDHLDENPTHPHPVVPLAQLGSLEDLTAMDIQTIITTKPHPITFPDRVIWFVFNIFAAPQLSVAIIFLTGFGTRTESKPTVALDVVFIVYGALATIVDLGVNCIPLRVIHCIYPMAVLWFYGIYTYLLEYYAGVVDVMDRFDWKNNPNETLAFFVGSSVGTVLIHVIICGIAYCRNKAICIFSKPAVVESALGKHAQVINELIEKDKSVKKFVASPNFDEAFQEEQIEELRLAKEREAQEERKRERVVKVYEKGAEVFEELLIKAREKVGASDMNIKSVTPSVKASIKASFRRSIYRPYSSDMTIDEFLENLTRDDGIIRTKKPEMKGGLPPDFNWVKEKQKPQKKVPISGIKKEVKPKKWNEFYTPPDSLQELTLNARHQERGRGKNDAQLETYNEKLLKIPIFHHVTPGPLSKGPEPEDLSTRKRKHSDDTDDGNDETVGKPKPKSRPLTANQTLFKQKLKDDIRKETLKGEPPVLANKAGKSVPQGKDNVTMTGGNIGGKSKSTKPPGKTPVTGAPRMSLTGIKVHENWVPLIPVKVVEPPKLKWFLGDSSFMPVPMPPPPPVIPPSPSLDKKTLLENEKTKIEMELKEKLKSPKIKEKLRELRIRQSIRDEEQRRASEMEQQKRRETEDTTQNMAFTRTHHAVSAYIREQTKRMELKEARLKAKMEKNRRPHFIALNINKKTEDSDEKALLRKRRLRHQQEKSRRLAYEQMRKPRQTMIFDDIDNSHANNQLVPLLLLNVDEKAKHEILNKRQSQGILKNDKDNINSDATKSNTTIMPGLEKVSPALAKRDLRSNLQLHARAHARGPMAESVYHPLKIPKKGTTPHVLTYHYLDDKLPHTGGQRTVEQSELEHYHHHPGTHVHHPMLNLEHSEGPHQSLRSALKEHVSSKVKDLHRHRYTHPALESLADLPAESAKKDVSHENPFRVVAFHPIVQYRSVQEKGPKEPTIKSSIAPKAKESYPREELKKLEEEHSDDSIKSETGGGRQRQAQGFSEKKKPNQLKDLLAGPLAKPKKPG